MHCYQRNEITRTFREIGFAEELGSGVKNIFKYAKALSQQLNTSLRTIERWLKKLRATGKIDFISTPKIGGYQVKKK